MCPSCKAARQTDGLWAQYNVPQCVFCVARLIQQIGKLRTPTSDEIAARRRAVLADAIAYGHQEIEIRRLAKVKELALEPVEVKAR